MSWGIHRVSLATHDLAAAHTFFGDRLGLGHRKLDDGRLAYGAGSRGLRVVKPRAALATTAHLLLATAGQRHVAIEVGNLNRVVTRLDKAAIPYAPAPPGDFDVAAVYTVDPSMNVVAFCQGSGLGGATVADADIQPWEKAWGWGVHHVNLQAGDVRETVAFYVEIAGLTEGRWRAPEARGNFSIDTSELAILPLGTFNRGLHIIKADPGFAHRNNFPHNPSIGGHPAFFVPDVKAVKARLEGAGTLVSDAGVYAMVGMHQIYVLDPTGNMIEVNQFV